jgi:hypothetical protein
MTKISPSQQYYLVKAAKGDRITYSGGRDSTFQALQRRGFASYSNSHDRYGKEHWWITDKGVEEGKKIIKRDAAKK